MLDASLMTPYRYARLIEAAGLSFSDCTTTEEVNTKLQETLVVGFMQGPVVIANTDDQHILLIPDTFDTPSWQEVYDCLLEGPVTDEPIPSYKIGQ